MWWASRPSRRAERHHHLRAGAVPSRADGVLREKHSDVRRAPERALERCRARLCGPNACAVCSPKTCANASASSSGHSLRITSMAEATSVSGAGLFGHLNHKQWLDRLSIALLFVGVPRPGLRKRVNLPHARDGAAQC